MIVVDTHAALWVTQNPAQLSKRAHKALIEERERGTLAIADITLRELAVIIAKGRVRVNPPLPRYLSFIESTFQVVPITAEIAERSLHFSAAYPKDPADRLIGATALVHGAKLVTADEKIRASGEVECVW